MKETDIDILTKSLKMIASFSDNCAMVNSASEYLKIHSRNISMLEELAILRKSHFIKRKIEEYPDISKTEIEHYIAKERKDRSLLSITGGIIIDNIYNLIKNKGLSTSQIKHKLKQVQSINETLLKVVENPYLEKLYSTPET